MPLGRLRFFGESDLRLVWMLTILVALPARWADPPGSYGADSSEPRGSTQVRSRADRVQSLVEILRRLDADKNGSLEPDEIPDIARRYIERWAKLADLDVTKPLPVKELEKGIRLYYTERESPPHSRPRRTQPSAPDANLQVRDFGPDEDQPPVPGFGADLDPSVVILQTDLNQAADRLRSYDRNRDGYLDRHEVSHGRWSDDVFQYDANRDNRISRQELAVRYAKRRIREAAGRSRSASARSRAERREREESDRRRARQEEERSRRDDPRNREAWYVAGSIMYRYDVNRNGYLERNEWQNLGEKAESADADRRGRVDRRELVEWLLRVADRPNQGLPPDLPEWYRRRDLNSDTQITMAEFAEQWTEEKVAEFGKYDLNGDGIITPDECAGASSLPKGTYRNHRLQIISAGATVYSEITVTDEEPIGDLDVQISITHTYDSRLDAFLIGPYGDRVELFTAVGRDDDHFHNTVFDDEAPRPITEGRPPFAGSYRPEATAKRQPSLRQFYGKPIDGTWTLMIQAGRSDRPGALHGWSLIATPAGDEDSEEPDRSEPDRSGRNRFERDGPEPDRSRRDGPPGRRFRR